MQLKNVVITGMIIALIIPFILLTDIYPFFRFGMFAEKVNYPSQMEIFAVRYIDDGQLVRLLDEEQFGVIGFSYMLRNYYYRNQSKELLQHIHKIYADQQSVKEWQLLKINSTVKPPYRSDTIIVESFVPNNIEL